MNSIVGGGSECCVVSVVVAMMQLAHLCDGVGLRVALQVGR